MDIKFYDIEVFSHDFTITFKSLQTSKIHSYHNNNYGVKEYMSQENFVLCGWNNKMYDDYILLAILNGATPEILKRINDFIIVEKQLPWEHSFLRGCWKNFNSFDIKDDLPKSLSLKEAEGNLGMNIEETSVNFNINRKLTDEEVREVIKYNIHDVEATHRVFEQRKDYLMSKILVGNEANLDELKSLRMTNGKLVAELLGAVPTRRFDERDLVYPSNLDKSNIPPEIFDFYDRMLDSRISDTLLFKGEIVTQSDLEYIKSKSGYIQEEQETTDKYLKRLKKYAKDTRDLKVVIDGVECVYAFGGVHGARPNYISKGDKNILLWDVRSLYPSVMIEYELLSRNIPNPKHFEDIYYRRIEAKARGDKKVDAPLKLVLNTAYGVTLNKHNAMFDPRQGRMVCIYGQLFLTDLTMKLLKSCPSFSVIQLNTDGIMFEISDEDLPLANEIRKEWEERTRFVLGEDVIKKIYQKDVNNYVMLTESEKIVAIGGFCKHYFGGTLEKNSLVVTHKALVNYLIYDIPVEKTINNETDIFNFQMIAKTGNVYTSTFHEINGEMVEVQKVNRVYATTDKKYGTIYKYRLDKNGKPSYTKIASLPENSIVDNSNQLTIQDIDKQFYIDLTKNRINQFLGKGK